MLQAYRYIYMPTLSLMIGGYEMLYKGQITVQSHGQNVKQVICMQEPKMVA
jgi:hypothetical protein